MSLYKCSKFPLFLILISFLLKLNFISFFFFFFFCTLCHLHVISIFHPTFRQHGQIMASTACIQQGQTDIQTRRQTEHQTLHSQNVSEPKCHIPCHVPLVKNRTSIKQQQTKSTRFSLFSGGSRRGRTRCAPP